MSIIWCSMYATSFGYSCSQSCPQHQKSKLLMIFRTYHPKIWHLGIWESSCEAGHRTLLSGEEDPYNPRYRDTEKNPDKLHFHVSSILLLLDLSFLIQSLCPMAIHFLIKLSIEIYAVLLICWVFISLWRVFYYIKIILSKFVCLPPVNLFVCFL